VGAEALAFEDWVLEADEGQTFFKAEWYTLPSLACATPDNDFRFKLHLRPRPHILTDVNSTIPPLPPNKTATDVFADFLRYLFQCAKGFIIESHPSGKEYWTSFGNDIEFVLSHPNGWEGAQQAQMRRAAVMAGLISDSQDDQSRIRFVTEGEASLHYCINHGLSDHIENVSLPVSLSVCALKHSI
jgi:hypothetical protein